MLLQPARALPAAWRREGTPRKRPEPDWQQFSRRDLSPCISAGSSGTLAPFWDILARPRGGRTPGSHDRSALRPRPDMQSRRNRDGASPFEEQCSDRLRGYATPGHQPQAAAGGHWRESAGGVEGVTAPACTFSTPAAGGPPPGGWPAAGQKPAPVPRNKLRSSISPSAIVLCDHHPLCRAWRLENRPGPHALRAQFPAEPGPCSAHSPDH